MNLAVLTNEELLINLTKLNGEEKEVTLNFLIHLFEFDNRKLYLSLGYSSLFDYCVRKLKYSSGSAFRRIGSARYLAENPHLKESFLNGDVSLCSLSAAAKTLREETPVALDIIGKSKKEVEALTEKINPGSKPKEIVKEISVKPKETSALPLFASVTPQKEPKIEERYELTFSVSKEVYEKFTALKTQLSNNSGKVLTLENTFNALLDRSEPLKERKTRSHNENARAIPVSLKREIFIRDNAQCSFVSDNGIRCTENHHLEFDHIMPFGIGGKTNKENLRILCSGHNKHVSEITFGAWQKN